MEWGVTLALFYCRYMLLLVVRRKVNNFNICKRFWACWKAIGLMLIKNLIQSLLCFDFPEQPWFGCVLGRPLGCGILPGLHGLVIWTLIQEYRLYSRLRRPAEIEFPSKAATLPYRLGWRQECALLGLGSQTKNGPLLASFRLFLAFMKQTNQFIQQINVKYVHPLSGTGIRTHNVLNTSLCP